MQRRLVSRGRWRLVWPVCCQGWSCPGPTSPRPRPLLGHSSAFQATTGPSGGQSRTQAGHLEAIWPTWSRGWRLQQQWRRLQLTLSLRTSPTLGLASKPTRMDSNTQLSLDESSLETSGNFKSNPFVLSLVFIVSFLLLNEAISAWRCRSPSKPVQTMSFRPLTTRQKRRKGWVGYLLLLSLHPKHTTLNVLTKTMK